MKKISLKQMDDEIFKMFEIFTISYGSLKLAKNSKIGKNDNFHSNFVIFKIILHQ